MKIEEQVNTKKTEKNATPNLRINLWLITANQLGFKIKIYDTVAVVAFVRQLIVFCTANLGEGEVIHRLC